MIGVRCAVHDLATGTDGKCVLCRRTLAPAPSRRASLASVGMATLHAAGLAYGASRAAASRASHQEAPVSSPAMPVETSSLEEPGTAVGQAARAPAPRAQEPSGGGRLRF